MSYSQFRYNMHTFFILNGPGQVIYWLVQDIARNVWCRLLINMLHFLFKNINSVRLIAGIQLFEALMNNYVLVSKHFTGKYIWLLGTYINYWWYITSNFLWKLSGSFSFNFKIFIRLIARIQLIQAIMNNHVHMY